MVDGAHRGAQEVQEVQEVRQVRQDRRAPPLLEDALAQVAQVHGILELQGATLDFTYQDLN